MSKGDLCSIDRRLVKAAKLVISDVKFYDFPNVFTNRCEAAVQKLLTKHQIVSYCGHSLLLTSRLLLTQ